MWAVTSIFAKGNSSCATDAPLEKGENWRSFQRNKKKKKEKKWREKVFFFFFFSSFSPPSAPHLLFQSNIVRIHSMAPLFFVSSPSPTRIFSCHSFESRHFFPFFSHFFSHFFQFFSVFFIFFSLLESPFPWNLVHFLAGHYPSTPSYSFSFSSSPFLHFQPVAWLLLLPAARDILGGKI